MEDGGVDTIVTESREYLLPFIFSVLTFMKYTVIKLQMPNDVTCKYASMTTLLTHTVAHSTKPSFRPKTNNQPPKKFLSLALS